MFGEYEELEPAEAAKVDAIRSTAGFLGTLARGLLSRGSRYRFVEDGQNPLRQQVPEDPPCSDAELGDNPGETPCAERARELQQKAAEMRARRR